MRAGRTTWADRLEAADRWLTVVFAVCVVCVLVYLAADMLGTVLGLSGVNRAIRPFGKPLGGVCIVLFWMLVAARWAKRFTK